MPPGCRGARRPEKRVTARSGAPQKKCTGLALPRKRPRKVRKTRSAWTSTRQKRRADSASYARGRSSSSKGTGSATSLGRRLIFTARPSASSPTGAGGRTRPRTGARRATRPAPPSLARTRRASSRKSKSSSNVRRPGESERCEAPGGDVERDLPAMVDPGAPGRAGSCPRSASRGGASRRCRATLPGEGGGQASRTSSLIVSSTRSQSFDHEPVRAPRPNVSGLYIISARSARC